MRYLTLATTIFLWLIVSSCVHAQHLLYDYADIDLTQDYNNGEPLKLDELYYLGYHNTFSPDHVNDVTAALDLGTTHVEFDIYFFNWFAPGVPLDVLGGLNPLGPDPLDALLPEYGWYRNRIEQTTDITSLDFFQPNVRHDPLLESPRLLEKKLWGVDDLMEFFIGEDGRVYGNNCGNGPHDNDLENCLQEVADWLAVNPDAPPLLLKLDMKQRPLHHKATQWLNNTLRTIFADKLFEPKEILFGTGLSSLRQAVRNYGWPDAYDLRGKVFVTLLSGPLATEPGGNWHLGPNESAYNYGLYEYITHSISHNSDTPAAFVCPRITKASKAQYFSSPHNMPWQRDEMMERIHGWIACVDIFDTTHDLSLVREASENARRWNGFVQYYSKKKLHQYSNGVIPAVAHGAHGTTINEAPADQMFENLIPSWGLNNATAMGFSIHPKGAPHLAITRPSNPADYTPLTIEYYIPGNPLQTWTQHGDGRITASKKHNLCIVRHSAVVIESFQSTPDEMIYPQRRENDPGIVSIAKCNNYHSIPVTGYASGTQRVSDFKHISLYNGRLLFRPYLNYATNTANLWGYSLDVTGIRDLSISAAGFAPDQRIKSQYSRYHRIINPLSGVAQPGSACAGAIVGIDGDLACYYDSNFGGFGPDWNDPLGLDENDYAFTQQWEIKVWSTSSALAQGELPPAKYVGSPLNDPDYTPLNTQRWWEIPLTADSAYAYLHLNDQEYAVWTRAVMIANDFQRTPNTAHKLPSVWSEFDTADSEARLALDLLPDSEVAKYQSARAVQPEDLPNVYNITHNRLARAFLDRDEYATWLLSVGMTPPSLECGEGDDACVIPWNFCCTPGDSTWPFDAASSSSVFTDFDDVRREEELWLYAQATLNATQYDIWQCATALTPQDVPPYLDYDQSAQRLLSDAEYAEWLANAELMPTGETVSVLRFPLMSCSQVLVNEVAPGDLPLWNATFSTYQQVQQVAEPWSWVFENVTDNEIATTILSDGDTSRWLLAKTLEEKELSGTVLSWRDIPRSEEFRSVADYFLDLNPAAFRAWEIATEMAPIVNFDADIEEQDQYSWAHVPRKEDPFVVQELLAPAEYQKWLTIVDPKISQLNEYHVPAYLAFHYFADQHMDVSSQEYWYAWAELEDPAPVPFPWQEMPLYRSVQQTYVAQHILESAQFAKWELARQYRDAKIAEDIPLDAYYQDIAEFLLSSKEFDRWVILLQKI